MEGCKGVVDSVSIAGLNGPAALGVFWVVVGKIQWLHHSFVLAWDKHITAFCKQTQSNIIVQCNTMQNDFKCYHYFYVFMDCHGQTIHCQSIWHAWHILKAYNLFFVQFHLFFFKHYLLLRYNTMLTDTHLLILLF